MYRIIGADGREYGPVTAEQLRQWLAEGRANDETKVSVEGTTEWKRLSELPEFFPKTTPEPLPANFPGPYSTATVPRNNPLAVTGLILGIFSVTFGCCCYGLPFNLAGIICSALALAEIKNDRINQQGQGMAIAGLTLSIVSILLAISLLTFGAASHWTGIMRRIPRM